jgi:hypothetical protein
MERSIGGSLNFSFVFPELPKVTKSTGNTPGYAVILIFAEDEAEGKRQPGMSTGYGNSGGSAEAGAGPALPAYRFPAEKSAKNRHKLLNISVIMGGNGTFILT